MNLFKTTAYALTGMLVLAGCASEGEPGHKAIENAQGYMSFNVNLPTQNGTRALNDQFDDGTANEYQVDNGIVCLFVGKDEATAAFRGAYNFLDNNTQTPNGNLNITTTLQKTVAINKLSIGSTDNLYAFVMLNTDGIASADDHSLRIKDLVLAYIDAGATNCTISTLLEKGITSPMYKEEDKTHFFMSNTVECDQRGGTGVNNMNGAKTSVLVKLEPKLYDTEAEAEANPAGVINVERGVAKATLRYEAASATVGEETLSIKSIRWALDNTEPTEYIYRKYNNEWNALVTDVMPNKGFRFVGSNPFSDNTMNDGFRTYWAEDPNYSDPTAMLNTITKADYAKINWEEATKDGQAFKPLYCHENTFDVDAQNYGNTTRALIKVEYNVPSKFADGNIYTLDGDRNTMFTKSEIETRQANELVGNADLKALIEAQLKEGGKAEIATDWFTLTNVRDAETGVYGLADFSIVIPDAEADKFNSTAIAVDEAVKAKILDLVNNKLVVNCYENGTCYYEIRIMHFADPSNGDNDLAPLAANFDNTATSATVAYESDRAKYLGRYGMVRNNWYDIKVNSISGLGTAVPSTNPIDKPDVPDDNDKVFISFQINVMSWAKRTQSWDLK